MVEEEEEEEEEEQAEEEEGGCTNRSCSTRPRKERQTLSVSRVCRWENALGCDGCPLML